MRCTFANIAPFTEVPFTKQYTNMTPHMGRMRYLKLKKRDYIEKKEYRLYYRGSEAVEAASVNIRALLSSHFNVTHQMWH